MKKLFLTISALFMTSAMFAQQQELATFKVREAITLNKPIMNDSVNNKGEKFNTEKLLKTNVVLNLPNAPYTIEKGDDNGVVSLDENSTDNRLYIIQTKMRAELFCKGMLKVSSTLPFQLFVDNAPRTMKTTVEDSISMQSTKQVPLTLEPEKDYSITIKLLATADYKGTPEFKFAFDKNEGYKSIACVTNVEAPKRFSLDDTAFGKRVKGVRVSPNGDYLLTLFEDKFDDKKSYKYTQLSSLKNHKVILDNGKTNMSWMPKSNKLYYTVESGNGYNVITLDPKTLNEEVLFSNVPEKSFTWGPNEKYLYFYKTLDVVKEQGPLKRIVSPDDRIPGNRTAYYIVRYNPENGLSERLTYGYRTTAIRDISEDGNYLLFSSSKDNITERPFNLSSLYQVNLNTLKVDTLFFEEKFLGGAHYSPDAKELLLTASPEAFEGIGKNCGDNKIANDFDTQAFIMNLATKEIQPITKDFAPTVNFLQWNKDDGNIYFNTADKDCKNIYQYNPEKKTYKKLNLNVDVVWNFSLANNNAKVAAYCGQTDYNCGMAYTYNLRKEKNELIADPMQERLKDVELGECKPWTFTAEDGTTIDGRICLPPNFDANKKYPLIVYYYGGTTPVERGITSPYGAQLFASRDYVVYFIQPSGTIGYGQEFSARHVNAWGKKTAKDIIEGTKKFCKAHPFVDEKHIGCLGASYGGFMTQYLQTQTDIFAAAVSHAGISNLTSYWGEGYWGYSYNSVAAAESYPWNNPKLFTEQGSLFNADKINTPLLLLHGTVDTNVPIGESIQLFNALKILGKTVEFVTVEGENHFVLDYKKRIIWQNSIMAWFERFLKERPEWWENIYPKRYL